MKKVKIWSTVLIAVLCIAVLAACGTKQQPIPKGKEFKLSEYAMSIDDLNSISDLYDVSAAYSTVTKKDFKLEQISSDAKGELAKIRSDKGYQLYNIASDKILFANTYFTSINALGYGYPFYCLTQMEEDEESDSAIFTYTYCGPTGDRLVNKVFTSNSAYYGQGSYYEGGKWITYYSFSYYNDQEEYITKYYTYENSVLKEIPEEKINSNNSDTGTGSSGLYEVGDTLGLRKYDFADKEKYPSYVLKDYSYTYQGNSKSRLYTFYNGTKKTNSVAINNGWMYAIIGNYFYYYEMEGVSADAESGYNVEMRDDYNTKVNWTIWRVDVTKESKPEEVKSDYIISDMKKIYNKTTNSFDKAIARAYKKVNGIAIASIYSKEYTLIVDDDAHVSLDISDKEFSNLTNVYKLNDNRYLAGNTVYDADLNVIAQFDTSDVTVWKAQNLLLVRANGQYIFVNYDGKVLIPYMGSNNFKFIGDCIYVNGKVYSKNNPKGREINQIVKTYDYENVSLITDGLICKTISNKEKHSISFYDLNGNSIGNANDFVRIEDYYKFGKRYVVTYTSTDESVHTIIIS